MTAPVESALAYQRIGWSVIPIRSSGDADARKRPAISSWLEFQSAAADPDEIRAWWKENPGYNVGVVTGTVSRLVVLDLDGPKAAALLKEAGYVLPKTTVVQTGNGYHAYFSHAGDVIQNRVGLFSDGAGSKVDVRGEGGYVVAPPSVHGSGRVYQWARGPEELKPLPPDLELLLLEGHTPDETEKDENWYPDVSAGVDDGGRNNACARMAGYWAWATDGNKEATLRAVLLWNAQNNPPLSEQEVKTTVASIIKRHLLEEAAKAEQKKPKHVVLDAGGWAHELETAIPRKGEDVKMPGLRWVDGLVPGDLVVVAGRPGMGKSTWATQLCVHAAIQRYVPTWIVSAEMSRKQWAYWMAAVIADTPMGDLPHPLGKSILDAFRASPIAITDSGSISIAEIRQLAESRPGVKLIIVDHIGKIGSSRRENRVLEVGEVARGLKSMAKDLDCTVVALCQLNRALDRQIVKKPRLADLRESGEIEQEADVVFMLYCEENEEKKEDFRKVSMGLEKFRFGPMKKIDLDMDLKRRKFVEREPAK